MSDKFIKFGPAWLRDFGREGAATNFQNQGSNASITSSNTSVTNTSGPSTNTNSSQQPSKVQLAKLRYGREEILALYTAQELEPPGELKHLEHLYNSRGKPPLALINTFDDDSRENVRSGPPAGGTTQNERFGLGRGYLVFNESRGKARVPFIQRTVTTGRGQQYHIKQHGAPSLLGFPERAAEEPPFDVSHRPNWANGNGTNTNVRNGTEAEWNNNANKMYKSRWQGNNTNWRRQPGERRGDDEGWRSPEAAAGGARPRSMQQQDKWEREWGDKGERGREKPQPWNNNRRTWVAESPGAEENLPEWAVDNAEACGGTFDSSGAFHGYSNDDSNIPKSTSENTYALSRSHTQGSFTRSKTMDENSDDWWSSEKAKVLSPKRFDAVEPKFKKSPNNRGEESSSTSRSLNTGGPQQDVDLKFEELEIDPNDPEREKRLHNKKNVHFKQNLMESKTFDALMRSDINVEEASDERGNFKSVMITPNNSLRQRHQNIVPSPIDMTTNQNVNAQSGHPIGTPTQTIGDRFMGSKQSSPPEEEISKYMKTSRSEHDTMENTSPGSSYKSQAAMIASIRKPTEALGGSLPQSNDMNSGNMSYNRMHSAMSMTSPGSMMSAGMRLSIGSTTPKPTTPTGVARNGFNDILNMPLHPGETPGMTGANIPMPNSQHMAHIPMAASQTSTGLPMSNSQHIAHMQMAASHTSTGLPMSNSQNAVRSGLSELLKIPLPGETPSLNAAGLPMPKSQTVGVPIQNLQHGVGLSGRIMNSAGLMCQVTSSLPTTGICTTRVQSQAKSALPATNISSAGMVTSAMSNAPHPSTLSSGGISSTGLSAASVNPSVTGYSAAAAGLSSATSSLFLGQKNNNLPVGGGQSNVFLHGLQQQPVQSSYGSSMYSGITPNPAEQWYYEDPEKNIQGPFSSSAMYNWYRSGFFTANLMVRRACDSQMRPLGSYGSVVPFDLEVYGGMETRPYAPHDNVMKPQGGLTDVMNKRPNMPDGNINAMGFGNVGNNFMMGPNYSTQPMVDSLWGQPSPSADMMWMQPNLSNARNETRVNSLPMFLWNHESTNQSSLLPESIAKEMKTEDEILAQLRASQNKTTKPNIGFHNDPASQKKVASNLLAEETALSRDGLGLENLAKLITRDPKEISRNMNQNLEDLEKIIHNEAFGISAPAQHKATAVETQQASLEALEGLSVSSEESNYSTSAKTTDKQKKTDPSAKAKKKKSKKDESEDNKEQEVGERTEDSPVTKSKKEKKQTKKEIEKEKKEWVKEGFTIVKAPEKSKDNKKKETKLAEEVERKRKEEERLAEEEQKKRQAEAIKKQQEQQPQRASAESVSRKAPWSAVSASQASVTIKDGLTLAEIQRLEREKKLEQMKEQQQMMQIIAQQQQAALAREQEMQAGLGWAKKAVSNVNRGQSLTEIQKSEARKQQSAAVKQQAAALAVAATAAAANAASQLLEAPREAATSHHVWGSTTTEGGFWDTDRIIQTPVKPIEKPAEPAKPVKPVEVPKPKKKLAAPPVPAKKEITPQTEFENWCQSVLTSWSSKIDGPTFVGFLKDIESPFEVKDYVKCYLGETKESSDFARQFLEKRSKLLRSSTRSPADDLCSPAVAVNPRSASNAEYQEVKGKGKKSKKKMFKVDARILGFSVTAAEDRINVGDIDTA